MKIDYVIILCHNYLEIIEKLAYNFKIEMKTKKELYMSYKYINVLYVYIGSGDANIGDSVISLCKNYEMPNLIYLGTCGKVVDDDNAIRTFLPDIAYIGDGFTKYYRILKKNLFENKNYPSDLLKKFIAYNTEADLKAGAIFTIDSFYAEKKLIPLLEKNKCYAIDMETSAFFTACDISKKNFFAIHTITDIWIDGQNVKLNDNGISVIKTIKLLHKFFMKCGDIN